MSLIKYVSSLINAGRTYLSAEAEFQRQMRDYLTTQCRFRSDETYKYCMDCPGTRRFARCGKFKPDISVPRPSFSGIFSKLKAEETMKSLGVRDFEDKR